jgi:hypothetical protein
MTVQVPETLRYKGESLSFYDYPLHPYLASGKGAVKFQAPSTALHRGYVGTWSIEHARLYLTKLEGHVGEFANTVEVGLAALFPDSPDGVFAHWFSGQLCCPMGKLLNYGRGGFTSVYESDLFIQIEQGVVVSERVVMNGEAATPVPVPVRSAPAKNAEDKFLNLFRKKTE